MSFSPGSSEKATYQVTADLDVDDGSGEVKDYANLDWLKPTKALNTGDGLVNLF